MPTNKPITIDVTRGNISCSPSGGHIRAERNAQLQWSCSEEFTLTFALLDGSNTAAWPFQTPQAPFVQTKFFQGTLKDVGANEAAPAYKYTISVGNLPPLDPIIIVDK